MTKPEKLREIIEGATDGPWERHKCAADCAQVWGDGELVAICNTAEMGEGFTIEQSRKNSTFIAAARTELPLLLDLVEGIIPAIRGALSNPAIMATHNYEPLHKALLSYEAWANEGTKPEMEG